MVFLNVSITKQNKKKKILRDFNTSSVPPRKSFCPLINPDKPEWKIINTQ